MLNYFMNEVKHSDLRGGATIANCGYAASVLAGASLLDREIGGEKGTLSRELRKPNKPNEIRLRQRAGFWISQRAGATTSELLTPDSWSGRRH
jgi:hypothetical protein